MSADVQKQLTALNELLDLCTQKGFTPKGVEERILALESFPNEDLVSEFNALAKAFNAHTGSAQEQLRIVEQMNALYEQDPRLPDPSQALEDTRYFVAVEESIQNVKNLF